MTDVNLESVFKRCTMAQYNFEGDLENLSDRQIEFINKVILEHGFENKNVVFAPMGAAGDNFVGNLKRITVQGKNGAISIIAKFAPTCEMARKFMDIANIFRNEHIMYTKVLPKFLQLQIDAGVPEECQLKYAKCYGSLSEEPNEVILLEDLNSLNYTMLNKFESLTNECIKSVLKNFALLHSMSYVLKEKLPILYDDFRSNLKDFFSYWPEFRMLTQVMETQTLNVLEDPKHTNLVKNRINSCADSMIQLTKVDKNNKYSVILQGDVWTNNFLFRFKDQNLAESIMIDYQLSKPARPVWDVMLLFFNCTDHETRRKHYHEWLEYYHSELEKSLSYYNLHVDSVYPKEELYSNIKRYSKFIFGFCVFSYNVHIKKDNDAAKMKEIMGNTENMSEQADKLGLADLDEESLNVFKKKVVGLIDTFTEFDLF